MLSLVATAGLAFSTTQAFTAANVVPATNIGQIAQAITPANLEPSECRGSITVTSVVAGSGTVTATAANQLVLGSSGVDTLTDAIGPACMVGGAGSDSFSGKNISDLCIVSAATLGSNVKKCTIVATRP
jgi:Ca2+-binding RTX toxin-like protein